MAHQRYYETDASNITSDDDLLACGLKHTTDWTTLDKTLDGLTIMVKCDDDGHSHVGTFLEGNAGLTEAEAQARKASTDYTDYVGPS